MIESWLDSKSACDREKEKKTTKRDEWEPISSVFGVDRVFWRSSLSKRLKAKQSPKTI